MFEMKFMRIMTGVIRIERIKNEVVRRRTRVKKKIKIRINKSVLRWVFIRKE